MPTAYQITIEEPTHFVAMGARDVASTFRQAYLTRDEAADALADKFGLESSERETLKNRRLALPYEHGQTHYFVIFDCACKTPWCHAEGDGPQNWPSWEAPKKSAARYLCRTSVPLEGDVVEVFDSTQPIGNEVIAWFSSAHPAGAQQAAEDYAAQMNASANRAARGYSLNQAARRPLAMTTPNHPAARLITAFVRPFRAAGQPSVLTAVRHRRWRLAVQCYRAALRLYRYKALHARVLAWGKALNALASESQMAYINAKCAMPRGNGAPHHGACPPGGIDAAGNCLRHCLHCGRHLLVCESLPSYCDLCDVDMELSRKVAAALGYDPDVNSVWTVPRNGKIIVFHTTGRHAEVCALYQKVARLGGPYLPSAELRWMGTL